ncbi:sulfotransferase domain-containing protein [Alteromonas sp. ASW11-130]|uniref:sulfotransferase domain-containing protein n=1 Tax=Alteromonas sp. ASW11-130 TaxID=3015775 RepID=UPI00224260A1|nr:sulfotransferase domain-containing protein [Alteromonas sp. ASW11-130]MCW8091530.1 sulfotransferase domain-containing protein [Alteromonas sp. ASW11-130]
MRDRKKTFVLGLGHQKCGTTWLYKYLSESPYFQEGFTKEYHIWDALDLDALDQWKVKKPFFSFGFEKAATRDSYRYNMQHNPDYYFDYFASLYSKEKWLAADITPSYSGLTSERLSQIKERFAVREIELKVVILLREPLSRAKSAVRFNLDKSNYKEGISSGVTDFNQALKEYYHSEHCELRTRYNHIISEAQKVFSDTNIYVGVYENMFTAQEIARLSEFLGIDPNYEYAQVRVNKTRNSVEATLEDSLVKDYYSEVYDYCFNNIPVTRELWRI